MGFENFFNKHKAEKAGQDVKKENNKDSYEEKLKKAQQYIENIDNHGSSTNKARTKDLLLDKSNESYIESVENKARHLVDSGEFDKLQTTYRGGLEKIKTQEEKDAEMVEEEEVAEKM